MGDSTLGRRIAERRKLLGLSQDALGENLEVSWQTVSQWESDATIPGADEIIALSQVLDVSVAWLLGAEKLPKDAGMRNTNAGGAELSPEQLSQVQQVVSNYFQDQPEMKRKTWAARIAGICAAVSLLAAAITYTQTQEKLKTYTDDLDSLSKSCAALQGQLNALTQELEELRGAAIGDQLLGSYSVSARAAESGAGGIVAFEGFLNQTQPGDQVWFTVRLDGQEAAGVLCQSNGAAYTAEVELPAANGYSYQCLVVHRGGASSVQLLEQADDLAVNLAWGLEMQVSADFVWETRGSKLEIEACRLELKPPMLSAKGESAEWKQAELVFYQNGMEQQRVSLQKYVEYLSGTDEMDNWIAGTVYPEVKTISLTPGDTLEARILAVLDNGTETEKTVYTWTCDSTGHVTEVIPVG